MSENEPAVAVKAATQPIHGSIVKAVCRIMSSVSAVKKSQKNQHGGYMFASTDDIYAAITHKMGECGLMLVTLEDSCEVVRVEKADRDGKMVTSQWARITFSFVLATEEGTWSDANARRTLFIQVTGAQTFQAAQSYAEKSYLRSLFKLPTGDMDLDGMPQADNEEDALALNGVGKRKSSSGAKKDGTDKLFNEIRAKLQAATGNRDMLKQIRSLYAEEWGAMPARWHEILENEYEDAMDSCRTEAAE
jgi:hypothetical protein